MFLHTGLTQLHIFFMTRSTVFFSSTVFVISRLVFFLIRRQSFIRLTLKELRSNLATMLKMHRVTDVFLVTWPKFIEKFF